MSKECPSILLTIFMVCAVNTQSENVSQSPLASISLGKIRGNILTSHSGQNFFSFRGIRYAQPPVDELRFKPPVPVQPWVGVYDGTQDGPMCPQPAENVNDISEDCLHLNVYTRELSVAFKLPVVVFIHSGGFYENSGQSSTFGPQYLMDRNIVLVTINYRLGILGFLSTGTAEAPGNNGLKDQVIALRWVRDHIASFGGDPESVTIMGYSAGAMSVTLHMISPMSRGLFHKAIVMSGAATAQWKLKDSQLDLVKKQAHILNCPIDSLDNILNCLKEKNNTEIGNSLAKMFEFGPGNPILVWKPVVEPDFGQERFIEYDPTELFQLGKFARVPVIAGISKYEFLHPAITIIRNETLRMQMNVNFTHWAPKCFLYEEDSERSKAISDHLKHTFLNDSISGESSLLNLNNLFSDGVIGFGVHRFVQLASAYTRVYYYQNSYVGRYSYTYYPYDKPFGTVHHDDLLYLFVNTAKAPMFTQTDPENIVVERLTRLWTKFAKNGDPNLEIDEYLKNISWSPVHTNQLNYLDIGNDLTMKNQLNIERYTVWDRLFPINDRDNNGITLDSDEGRSQKHFPEGAQHHEL